MNVYDILSDAEREAIDAVMLESLSPQTALIIGDDDVTREMLAETLLVNGIQCRMAADAFEAFSLLETDYSIGLIITDLRMLPLHGLAFICQFRDSLWSDLPIVNVFGDAGLPTAIAAMHLKIVDCLLKPFNPDQLIRLVSRELGFTD